MGCSVAPLLQPRASWVSLQISSPARLLLHHCLAGTSGQFLRVFLGVNARLLSSSSTSFISESSTQTSSSTSQTSTSTTLSTPTATPSVYETTSGGSVHTVTTVVDASPSPTESAPAGQSFLQNKALSGVVLAFASLAGLIIIIVVATFTIRRRRHNRLLQEAISFDPESMNGKHYHGADQAKGSMEKLSVNTDNSHGFKITLPWMQERSPEPGKGYEYGLNHSLRGP
jgi:hypothetical protein